MSIHEKKHSFRIRRIYYDQILAGTKNYELRTSSERNLKLLLNPDPPRIAVFVCGKLVHRRRIKNIELIPNKKVPELLGRAVSNQGIKDLKLDSTENVICTWLGEAIEVNAR